MTTLEVYKTKSDELISLTLDLMPNVLRGDRVNRTFFFKEEDGVIEVDYFVYCGQTSLSDNCFYTIRDTESFDSSDFEVEDFEDIDFYAIGFDERISEAIAIKIEELEENASYAAWQAKMSS